MSQLIVFACEREIDHTVLANHIQGRYLDS